ncbi:nucleoside hydrolase [Georgenia sp. H159]|uniref:nucleoside hydrolase n=1 Tax=Georgenia sp. H159 TaxID=3076115 RepID=UPI002D76542C|nr:nucleoside hydrolase [Georgenia sp. H159]
MSTDAHEIRPVYYDCDTGIDDSMGLAYLLGSPEIQLVGVGTVSGNTEASQAAENTLRLLGLAGRTDIPVAIGEAHFLTHAYPGGPTEIHGDNGIGNVELPPVDATPVSESAAEMIVRLSTEHEGRLEIISVGPMTNLARALELDPNLPARVRKVTSMGGAALVPGNASPVGEANVWNDPEAAAAAVAASWPLTFVPLDVTLENVLEESHRTQLLSSERPLARAVGEILDHYFDFYLPQYGRRCSALHDPLAAAIGVGSIVPVRSPWVDVQIDATDGPGRGQTIPDLRGQRLGTTDRPGAHVRMVLATDRKLQDHLVERLTGTGERR